MPYDTNWDLPHQPEDDPYWQESDWYVFYDEKTGVGGAHRVGQKPALGTGQITLFCFGPDGQRYVVNDGHAVDRPISAENRTARGQSVGGHSVESMAPGRMRFCWNEPGCSAELVFEDDFYPARGWGKGAKSQGYATLQKTIQSGGKVQASGRLRGRIRLGDHVYDIDALAHRDRAWGCRRSGGVLMHRYRLFSGTVGHALSFASFSMDLPDGERVCGGFVVRDGVEKEVGDLRVIAAFDYDGLSPLGGTAVFTLEDGEVLKVDCSGVQGFMTPLPEHGSASSDTICVVEYGGARGFCTLELCNNPGRGSYIPRQSDLSLLAIEQGMSATANYSV